MTKQKISVKKRCGIIMPISKFGNFTEEFWIKIRDFIEETIREAGLDPVVAWEDDKSDLIHAKIIKNIADLPIMIGVMVGHNPNVMLECGMRLWTNKPIVLIVEEGCPVPFDVGAIQCLKMKTNCDYFEMTRLKKEIKDKLKLMTKADYKTFKSYYEVSIVVDEPSKAEKIPFDEFVRDVNGTLKSLQYEMGVMREAISAISTSAPIGPFQEPASITGPSGNSPCGNYSLYA